MSATAPPISIVPTESPIVIHSTIVRFFCILFSQLQNLIFTGYERTNPDPNGDGRAQCAVGSDFQEPFNVTVYADDGSVYKVGPNEVSTPSPDYAGKGFFNNTFYPLGGGDGPVVGPVDLSGFCETGPAPNVNENSTGISTTETQTPVPSSNSNSQMVSSNVPTNTVSVYSSSPTVLFPTGTSTGDRSQTSGVLLSGSGYHTPSVSKFTSFTGDANSERRRSRLLTFFGGIVIMIVYL